MKTRLLLLLICCSIYSFAAKPKHKFVKVTTDLGEVTIMLYNETPLHRDNFLKLAKAKFYDGTVFHRVIEKFMIQGGDPDSKNAAKGAKLGEGDVGYTIPAEFRDSIFHQKGALAAARDNNPEKASSGCQFYIVQGKVYTDSTLSLVEKNRLKFRLPEWEREVYKTIGGAPHLDKNYTVYGIVVKGLPMVDQIAAVKRDSSDRPLNDVKMTVTILKRRASKKLEKELGITDASFHLKTI
ncbi:MAG: peptidylprolyl isomerase [Pedobacter sp.]|nr:MAG: peptidylprolyl isomerase [Pedobacter sp.]